MALPVVVFGVGFDTNTGEPKAMYCGQDFDQAQADMSRAVQNDATINHFQTSGTNCYTSPRQDGSA
jgi:hypothetical protein